MEHVALVVKSIYPYTKEWNSTPLPNYGLKSKLNSKV